MVSGTPIVEDFVVVDIICSAAAVSARGRSWL